MLIKTKNNKVYIEYISAAGLRAVCVTFLLAPGIKGLILKLEYLVDFH